MRLGQINLQGSSLFVEAFLRSGEFDGIDVLLLQELPRSLADPDRDFAPFKLWLPQVDVPHVGILYRESLKPELLHSNMDRVVAIRLPASQSMEPVLLGSPLSPLLFAIFLDELLRLLPEDILVVAYADDLFIASRGLLDVAQLALQAALAVCSAWACRVQMTFSVPKCASKDPEDADLHIPDGGPMGDGLLQLHVSGKADSAGGFPPSNFGANEVHLQRYDAPLPLRLPVRVHHGFNCHIQS
ncbi:hypothetical protein BSKO_06112 [Bryopsis sp. KO-2023]|nr:hypothetical protein BSKO_06112 [Bryopsis sp. KO-2023]